MKTKFMGDKFIVWLVKMGEYESIEEPVTVYVVAENLMVAHEVAMAWSKEFIQDDSLVLSISFVSDCILDGRK